MVVVSNACFLFCFSSVVIVVLLFARSWFLLSSSLKTLLDRIGYRSGIADVDSTRVWGCFFFFVALLDLLSGGG